MSSSRTKLPPLTILPAWLILGLFFMVSMGMMFILSFAKVDDNTRMIAPIDDVKSYIKSGEAFHNYRDTYQPDPDMLDASNPYPRIFWKSTWLAILTTVLCLIISYPMAYYIAIIAGARWKNILLAMVAIPFWTSFLIRTYAWQIILQSNGLLNAL